MSAGRLAQRIKTGDAQHSYTNFEQYPPDDHLYSDTRISQKGQGLVRYLLSGSNAGTQAQEECSPMHVTVDRYLLNQPYNYANQFSTVVQGSPGFLAHVDQLDTCCAAKTKTVGHIGELCNPGPAMPPLGTFYLPPKVKRPIIQTAVPLWVGDAREGQRVQTTLDRPFEWSLMKKSVNISYDEYHRDPDQATRNGLMAFIIAALIILPIIPP
jgi:hypothetical protein